MFSSKNYEVFLWNEDEPIRLYNVMWISILHGEITFTCDDGVHDLENYIFNLQDVYSVDVFFLKR